MRTARDAPDAVAAPAPGWPVAAAPPPLAGRDVHLWLIRLDRDEDEARALGRTLSPDEVARAARLRRPLDRQRFTVGRAMLRHLLGAYAERPPARLAFRYASSGKPALAGRDAGRLSFNLSHSDGLALIAVARRGAVGIDLERMRPLAAADRIAERIFAPDERARLHRLDPAQRQAEFFAIWTRREARAKAIGDGLAGEIERPSAVPGWSVRDLAPAAGFAAALAAREPCGTVTCRRWPDGPGVG